MVGRGPFGVYLSEFFSETTTHVTTPFAEEDLKRAYISWNILSSCICTIVDVFLSYIVTLDTNQGMP